VRTSTPRRDHSTASRSLLEALEGHNLNGPLGKRRDEAAMGSNGIGVPYVCLDMSEYNTCIQCVNDVDRVSICKM